MLSESLFTSLRNTDRCTHSMVVRLQTSCCSPFSVVTKQNDPAAGAHLSPMSLSNAHHWSEHKVWVEHCPSRVMTSCTILVAVLTVFITRNCYGS